MTQQMRVSQTVINTATIGDVSSIAHDGSVWIAVLRQVTEGTMGGDSTELRIESFIVAVSTDDGEKWKYQDGPSLSSGVLEKLHPAVMRNIDFPESVMTIGRLGESTFMRQTLVDGKWVADKATIERLQKVLDSRK